MAVFQVKPESEGGIVPVHSTGGLPSITAIRYPKLDGTKVTVPLDGERRVTVTDERAIRQLKTDPRFILISE